MTQTPRYPTEVLTDTPIGYWRMETSAAYNETTAANNTLVGTPTVAAAKVVNGWTLNGTQYISLGGTYTDFTADETWSIEAWFKHTGAADGGTYYNIWRRNGAGMAALLRMHPQSGGTPGQIEARTPSGVTVFSPSRYDDGAWHHVVFSVNGTGTNETKLYVDGTNVVSGTQTATAGMSDAGGYCKIGDGETGFADAWIGQLDEVAIYGTALTSGRIATHYAAGPILDNNYVATAATASAEAPTAVVTITSPNVTVVAPAAELSATSPTAVISTQKYNTYTATPATATAMAGDAKAAVAIATRNPTDINVLWSGNPTFVDQNPSTSVVNFSPSNKPIELTLAALGLPSDAIITNADLAIVLSAVTTSITIRAESIDAAFSPSTVNYANRPAHGALVSGGQTRTTAGTVHLDVSSILKSIALGTSYGIDLEATAGVNSTVDTFAPWQPVLTITYWSDVNATINAVPATSTATMVDPTVSVELGIILNAPAATESHLMVNPVVTNTSGVAYGVTPFTSTSVMADPAVSAASIYVSTPSTLTGEMVDPAINITSAYVVAPFTSTGSMVDPVVTYTQNPVVMAEPFTATGMMNPAYFVMAVTVVVNAVTESHEMVAPVVTAELNAVVAAPVATGSGFLIPSVEAQQWSSDPYYNRVFATTDADDYWYRINEVNGTTLVDARSNAANTADLGGTYNFMVFGPESRKSMHFTNGWFAPRSAFPALPADNFGRNTTDFTFEFTIRTTDQNGVLAFGMDNVYQNPMYYNAISIKDGKVNVQYASVAGWGTNQTGLFDFSGIKRVDDGEWHHIVVAYGQSGLPESDMNNGVRIFIDGQLDRRRRSSVVPGQTALPDYWMGIPTSVSTTLPLVKNFTGDVMEVVFRRYANIVADDAQALYYDVFGIVPKYATPATATGVMTSTSGKGNKKRALVLWHNLQVAGLNQDPIGGFESITQAGGPPEDFDHNIALGFYQQQDFNDMDITSMYYMANDTGSADAYRDIVTDRPRLINLQQDTNMNDFDLIIFRNWPDENSETKFFSDNGYGPKEVDDFLASVRQAVVDGCGLEVTSPSLALRLGLISGATPVPTLYEKTSVGEKDARSAAIDPWGTGGSTTPTLPGIGETTSVFVWPGAIKSKKHVRITPILDQGDGQGFGSCTAHAAVGVLGTTPIYSTVSSQKLDHDLAMSIYARATEIDDDPNTTFPPDDVGASTINVAQACQERGLISGWGYSQDINDGIKALQTYPIMTAIEWFQGFDHPDANGFVSISGTVRGGHVVEIVEVNVTNQTVTAANSWGPGWGKNGYFTFSWADWSTLLGRGGNVTAFIPRNPWAPREDVSAESAYLDTHANNFQRVVAEVENITTLPSYFMSDVISTQNRTNGADGNAQNVWSYKLTDRTDGLVVGDTMADMTQWWDKILTSTGINTPSGYQWNKYMWAVNPDGLTVGTPVYKFATTIWNGNAAVANPYAEYIGGAIVRPGDVWGGVRIAGKVWMNFAEWPFDATPGSGGGGRGYMVRQLVPPDVDLVAMGEVPETDAMRSWDYSQYRVITVQNTAAGARHLVLNYDENGQAKYSYRRTPTATAPDEFEKYPTDTAIVLTWTHRGLAWLGARDIIVQGEAIVRPLVATSTGTLVDPVTVAAHGVTVTATVAQAIGVMNSPDEALDIDIAINVFAAEASGYMTGFGRVVNADPFLASGVIVDNFDMIHAGGEQVTLYLYNENEIDLYLKEDK